MSPTIRIDDEVFARLKNMGEAFVDTPNSVLRRVLKLEDKDSIVIEQELEVKKEKEENGSVVKASTDSKAITAYSHPRLCFKSSHIEPLSDEDIFQVETAKNGIFRFTKAEFYRVFPNVIKSVSYRENGIYHYPTVPRKALAYKVG
jgi:predicted transcriptional regulator